jgi:peptide/nickel transport system substrate-binding protein
MKKIMFVAIMSAFTLCWNLPNYAQGPSGELRIGVSTLYDQTFLPMQATQYRKIYLEPMYDFIVGVDKDGNFDPKQGLASNWEQSADFLSWTFYIRDGVKFHNGDPLTNEDIKETIERAGTKKNLAFNRAIFEASIERVDTVPPNKVVVRLKKAWPNFLYYLSTLGGIESMVAPKKYIQEKGEDYFNTHPIGSGPYKFSEWREGTYIKLVAQDSHWRVGIPKYKYLTFKLIPEEGSREADLRSGELDIIQVGIEKGDNFRKDGFPINMKNEGINLVLMWLQDWRSEFPTNKRKVRQALIYAINKQEIVDQLLRKQGTVMASTLPMFTWAIEYKSYLKTPYDPTLAKKLLAEAGYADGFTMYIYSFVTKLPETKMINEAIAGYWEAIGVKVKILEMDYSAFRPYWVKDKDTVGPAMLINPWTNRPVFTYRDHYHSTARFSHKKDPNLDKLIEEFEGQRTMEGYIAAGQKAVDYIMENFYSTGICSTHELFAMSKNVPIWEMGKGVDSYRWEYIGLK